MPNQVRQLPASCPAHLGTCLLRLFLAESKSMSMANLLKSDPTRMRVLTERQGGGRQQTWPSQECTQVSWLGRSTQPNPAGVSLKASAAGQFTATRARIVPTLTLPVCVARLRHGVVRPQHLAPQAL